MTENLRIVLVRIGQDPEVLEVEHTLSRLQRLVGGGPLGRILIGGELPGNGAGIDLWFNEEAARFPINRVVGPYMFIGVKHAPSKGKAGDGWAGPWAIRGDFFVAAHDNLNHHTTGLTEAQAAHWTMLLAAAGGVTTKE